jgi:hypothetical protein
VKTDSMPNKLYNKNNNTIMQKKFKYDLNNLKNIKECNDARFQTTNKTDSELSS